MNPKGTILFSIVSYGLGWVLYLLNQEQSLIYLMFLFLYIQLMTVSHPLIFHYGVMRPIQLSLSSVGILFFINNHIPFFIFCLIAVIGLVFIEKEDMFPVFETEPNHNKLFGMWVKRMVATAFLPFSVTYAILILRPYDEILNVLVVFVYFSALFVMSKWFSTIVSFGISAFIQIFLFVYIIELYFSWTTVQIESFFVSILLFLAIGYSRKGILNYAYNIKK